ncbi:hypothetical protein DTO006G1_7242 [Penicillium roqueforti]|uniref:uncharacterized protein n=1 Tax=Penicillium roqueforti TaxID=5082 RepID=UPI001909AD4E|nr:uncharacterized protein LCP9604111_7422 [Penicillium roqueforti]KAF9243988.1 hypothetical protein LCP9604111_7422 [Penicillium roqueforti]KAI1831335.1 hypothetical protein CBS147337_7801 [Penicillium roqueforti]KAI2671458.1 hypothetical protein CBS147355_8740 [Penicillium roqueforti]KAI2684807.1 hypothetical protein LCP963914a_4899 [Penicillium roqueforti]KAI2696160.1 hypothetical protein CBS147372_8651 [Penicillium roqueforti]
MRRTEVPVKGGFREASLSHVDLPDDELATIQRVVSFLYHQDYEDTDGSYFQNRKCASGNGMEPHAAMWNNLGVFMAADKFDISRLKILARSRIMNWISENARGFPLIVQQIWITIPPLESEIRDAIIKSISCDAQEFLAYDESMVIMTDIPDITIAVLKKIAEENSSLKLKLQRQRKTASMW